MLSGGVLQELLIGVLWLLVALIIALFAVNTYSWWMFTIQTLCFMLIF